MSIVRNKFDKRIRKLSDIQSLKQYDDKYVGKSGYFTDSLCHFKNLDVECTKKDVLTNIYDGGEAGDYIFECSDGTYRFFLPEELLEEPEKKYKVFSLEKFLKIFKVGDVICFRRKDSTEVHHKMFTGYIVCTDGRYDIPGIGKITLGAYSFGLGSLFNDYELFLNGKWQPFGIEE